MNRLACRVMVAVAGMAVLGMTPSSFPSSKLVMPQAVTFTAKDGQQTHAKLFLPRETTSLVTQRSST